MIKTGLFIISVLFSTLLAQMYTIQWAALTEGNVKVLTDSLSQVNIPFYTVTAHIKGVTYHRVRTGTFATKDEARQAAFYLNINSPYIAIEKTERPLITLSDLKPQSYAGMIPVIIRDSVPMPKNESDVPFCFGFPSWLETIPDDMMMQRFSVGFFDVQTKGVHRLYEGLNNITTLSRPDHYVFTLAYTGDAPGAYHPYYETHYLYTPKSDSIIEIPGHVGGLKPTKNGFYLRSMPDYHTIMEGALFEEKEYYYSFEGKLLHEKSSEATYPLELDSNKVSGKNWSYTLPNKRASLHDIGNNTYAVRVIINEDEAESDDGPDYNECCSICHFDIELYLFTETGFLQKIYFPVERGLMPLFITLHEDPCSA